jgi:hypothetical protein
VSETTWRADAVLNVSNGSHQSFPTGPFPSWFVTVIARVRRAEQTWQLAKDSRELFEALVYTGKQYPVGNQLYSAPVPETADLGQVAARDPYRFKCATALVPVGVFPRYPSFDDPRLATNDRLSKAAQRADAILNVNNGAHVNGSDWSISRFG